MLIQLEQRFEPKVALQWMEKYWYWSVVISLVYLGLIIVGTHTMKKRPAFQMRRALTMWNSGLATFSIIGSVTLVPELARILFERGFSQSVCKTAGFSVPHLSIWIWLFTLSKVIELGDTLFIVLRKTPLSFLHWYHHVTVLTYTWFAYSYPKPTAVGMWFTCMNYSVHSVMYSYYAVKASGRKIPQWISQVITVLQLSQMFVAIICNAVAYISYHSGKECDFYDETFKLGMVIYGTYAMLFLNFFYQRYGSKAE